MTVLGPDYQGSALVHEDNVLEYEDNEPDVLETGNVDPVFRRHLRHENGAHDHHVRHGHRVPDDSIRNSDILDTVGSSIEECIGDRREMLWGRDRWEGEARFAGGRWGELWGSCRVDRWNQGAEAAGEFRELPAVRSKEFPDRA